VLLAHGPILLLEPTRLLQVPCSRRLDEWIGKHHQSRSTRLSTSTARVRFGSCGPTTILAMTPSCSTCSSTWKSTAI
jgi:hypothetical protein